MNKTTSHNSFFFEKTETEAIDTKYIKEFVIMKKMIERMETNNFIVKRIYTDIKSYIAINCDHHIIDDYVDLDPDRGGNNVKYCEYCYKTFT